MIKGLDHIAIAVENMDSAIELWQKLSGASLEHREHVKTQGAHVAFLRIGDFRIELISSDSPDSAVGKFLKNRGPGLHHIALSCTDGQSVLNALSTNGARLINETLRNGAENTKVGFVHPTSFGGVLIEIVEQGEEQ